MSAVSMVFDGSEVTDPQCGSRKPGLPVRLSLPPHHSHFLPTSTVSRAPPSLRLKRPGCHTLSTATNGQHRNLAVPEFSYGGKANPWARAEKNRANPSCLPGACYLQPQTSIEPPSPPSYLPKEMVEQQQSTQPSQSSPAPPDNSTKADNGAAHSQPLPSPPSLIAEAKMLPRIAPLLRWTWLV